MRRTPRKTALSISWLLALCLSVILASWGARPCHAYPPFTIETADAGGVGSYTSIQVDVGDNPQISYYDEVNGNLKYAHKSGGS